MANYLARLSPQAHSFVLANLLTELSGGATVSECMPPRKDFKSPTTPLTPQFSLNAEPKPLNEKRTAKDGGAAVGEGGATLPPNSIVKNHPLKRRQFQSLDEQQRPMLETGTPEKSTQSVAARSGSGKMVKRSIHDMCQKSVKFLILE